MKALEKINRLCLHGILDMYHERSGSIKSLKDEREIRTELSGIVEEYMSDMPDEYSTRSRMETYNDFIHSCHRTSVITDKGSAYSAITGIIGYLGTIAYVFSSQYNEVIPAVIFVGTGISVIASCLAIEFKTQRVFLNCLTKYTEILNQPENRPSHYCEGNPADNPAKARDIILKSRGASE